MKLSHHVKTRLLIVLAVLCGAAVLMLPPVPQDPAYHDFADKRGLWGIANFGDVLSNLPYFLTGILGMLAVYRRRSDTEGFRSAFEKQAMFTAFAGIFLVGLGSGYYHLVPDNGTLFWDRLPMTIGFMAIYAMLIGERVHEKAGKILFPLLLVLGAAAALYWHITEQAGRGDLRFYAVVQFFPLITAPLILLLFPPKYSGTKYLWWLMLFYALAKFFEHFDQAIFTALGHAVSGHTLKHLSSAFGTYYLVLYAQRRKYITGT
jgi:hypothetical protein